jgi:hypothetical protein
MEPFLGTGKSPVKGDRVVVDWEGYTIGYYGRPFQTRNKVMNSFLSSNGLASNGHGSAYHVNECVSSYLHLRVHAVREQHC